MKPKTKRILIVSALVIVALWLSLSFIVTFFVNKKISRIGIYRGSIETVHLNFWRGAYSIVGLKLTNAGGAAPVPFFHAKRIDFNVSWKALLEGSIVGDMEIFSPELNFVDAEEDEQKQTDLKGTGQDTKKTTKELSPLKLDRILVHDGKIHFRRPDGEPPVDIYVHDIQAEAKNLTNSKDLSDMLLATLEARGRAMEKGDFDLLLTMNPFEKDPTFETRARLAFYLPELNSFLKHYVAMEAKGGRMDIFIEGAAAEGGFKGYVKPLMKGLDLVELQNDGKSPQDVVKGGIAKFFSELFKNRKKDDNATKIDFAGTFENPDIRILEAILQFFRNAFAGGIQPGFEKKDEPHVTPQGTLSEEESEPEASEAAPAETE